MPCKIYWTLQAKADLRGIRSYIARDAPATASAYVQQLRQSVERLREFPFSGQVVPELGRQEIREILHGNYRLIYRTGAGRIDILTVFHSAQILSDIGP